MIVKAGPGHPTKSSNKMKWRMEMDKTNMITKNARLNVYVDIKRNAAYWTKEESWFNKVFT